MPKLRADRYDPRRINLPKTLLKRIKLQRMGRFAGYVVWVVDGAVVRDEVDVDFALGGNPARYAYVPSREVWVEATSDADLRAIVAHEVSEAELMVQGATYDAAHERASASERRLRRTGKGMPVFVPNPSGLKTICMWCKRVIFDGPPGPDGGVSHGLCYDCAVEHAEEFGLTEEDLAEIREEQRERENPYAPPQIPLEQLHHAFPKMWLPALVQNRWDWLNDTFGELVPLRLGAGGFGVVFAAVDGKSVVKITSDAEEANVVQQILLRSELANHPGVVHIHSITVLHEPETKPQAWAIHEERLMPLVGTQPLLPRRLEKLSALVKAYRLAADAGERSWLVWNDKEHGEQRYAGGVLCALSDMRLNHGKLRDLADFLLGFFQTFGVALQDVHLDNLARRTPGGPLVVFDLGFTKLPWPPLM